MSWLQTFTGRRIDLFHPDPNDIEIIDIAHALSHECRYAGHVSQFYSVAQHSVLVSQYCNAEDALWGLLHDASEAYLGDVVKPLKVTGAFRQYRALERRMQAAVCSRFGLPVKEPVSVRRVDKAMVAIEARELLARCILPPRRQTAHSLFLFGRKRRSRQNGSFFSGTAN